MVVLGILLAASMASGAVMEVYGSIMGTAEVKSAVVVDAYDTSADEVRVRNKADVTIDGGVEKLQVRMNTTVMKEVTPVLDPGETANVTFSDHDLTSGDTLYVIIDGTEVDSTGVTS